MISKYISEIENALQYEGAHLFYFPFDKMKRKEANLRLGREFGYGLGLFEDWEDYAGTLYGRIIVKNSLDSTGVAISAKEWLGAIREGASNARRSNPH